MISSLNDERNQQIRQTVGKDGCLTAFLVAKEMDHVSQWISVNSMRINVKKKQRMI